MPVLCNSFVTVSLEQKKKGKKEKEKKPGKIHSKSQAVLLMHGQWLWKATAYIVCLEALPSTSQLSRKVAHKSIKGYKEQLGKERNKKFRKMPHMLSGWEVESGRCKQED